MKKTYLFKELNEKAQEKAMNDNLAYFNEWYFGDMHFFCVEYLETQGYNRELIEMLNIKYNGYFVYSDCKRWSPSEFSEFFDMSESEISIIDRLTYKKGLVIEKENDGDYTDDFIKLGFDFFSSDYNNFYFEIDAYVNKLETYLNDLLREYNKYIDMYEYNATDVQYDDMKDDTETMYNERGEVINYDK